MQKSKHIKCLVNGCIAQKLRIFNDSMYKMCVKWYIKDKGEKIRIGDDGMDVLQLAEYGIRRASSQETPITNLKLQKTLYYLQGYSLRCFDEPAFKEEIRSWQYGPVSPTAYFAYSHYGASPLEMNEEIQIPTLRKEKEKLFNTVIDACLKMTARELVQKTHEEDPWKKTQSNKEISCNIIRKYFCANNPLDIEVDW